MWVCTTWCWISLYECATQQQQHPSKLRARALTDDTTERTHHDDDDDGGFSWTCQWSWSLGLGNSKIAKNSRIVWSFPCDFSWLAGTGQVSSRRVKNLAELRHFNVCAICVRGRKTTFWGFSSSSSRINRTSVKLIKVAATKVWICVACLRAELWWGPMKSGWQLWALCTNQEEKRTQCNWIFHPSSSESSVWCAKRECLLLHTWVTKSPQPPCWWIVPEKCKTSGGEPFEE